MAGEFKLEDVLPWGRNLAEYDAFFALEGLTRETRILDCAAGPASFNAEMTDARFHVVSVDPLYQFSEAEIASRVADTREKMAAGLAAALHRFVFTWHGSIERHMEIRMEALRRFLADFERGKTEGRYLTAALPDLPFDDDAFNLALCSHFLFLYSDHFDADDHVAFVEAMMRAAGEARIFPLLDLEGERSRHVEPVRRTLAARGYETVVERVDYEFQKGGNEMMRIYWSAR